MRLSRLAALISALAVGGCGSEVEKSSEVAKSTDVARPGAAVQLTSEKLDWHEAEGPACMPSRWCWMSPWPAGEYLRAIWALTKAEAWAVGSRGRILHFVDNTWRWLETSVSVELSGVWASSSTDVWIVGRERTILHWDGTAWRRFHANGFPEHTQFRAVWGASANDVWIVGNAILHWDGSSLSAVESRNDVDFRSVMPVSIAGLSATDVWFAGGALLAWDGHDIVERPLPFRAESVWRAGPNEAWAVSGEGLHRWDGKSWTGIQLDKATLGGKYASPTWVGGTGPDDVWVGSSDGVARWDGSAWSRVPEAPPSTQAISSTGRDDVWLAGWRGVHRGDHTSLRAMSAGFGMEFGKISGTAADDVWVASRRAIWHWNGSSWTKSSRDERMSGPIDLFVLRPNRAWVVGEDGGCQEWNGKRWRFDRIAPANLYGVWASASSGAWAVGSHGTVLRQQRRSWSKVRVPTKSDLLAVWGAADEVWAVGEKGTVLRRRGTTWTTIDIGTDSDLHHVWASGPDDIWVSGTSGTLRRWNGREWTSMDTGTGTGEIWGDGPNNVWVAADQRRVLHWDGERWDTHEVSRSETGAVIAGDVRDVWGSGGSEVWISTDISVLRRAPAAQ